MTDEKALEEIKDALIHLEGAINILVEGKYIIAYRKFMGLKDKLNTFGKRIEKDVQGTNS